MQIEFDLAPLTIDTTFTEISSSIVFLPANFGRSGWQQRPGEVLVTCVQTGCRAHPSPFPADLEIKPGRGQEETFHLPTSASLWLAVL